MKKVYEVVICIKDGIYDGVKFNIGDLYPIIGSNNGQQLAYSNTHGDTKIMLLHNVDDKLIEASYEYNKNYPEFKYAIEKEEKETPLLLRDPRFLQRAVCELENIITDIESNPKRTRLNEIVCYLKSLEEYNLPF